MLNANALPKIKSSVSTVERGIARLLMELPQPGEPVELYVLRAHLHSDDVQTASIALPGGGAMWVAFVDTIVDLTRLHQEVIEPLQRIARTGGLASGGPGHPLLPGSEAVDSMQDGAHRLLSGHALIYSAQGTAAVSVASFPSRPVAEPSTEEAILGPKQAFTEDIESNIGALRHRLKDDQLRVQVQVVARRSRTKVALVYLADVVYPHLVEGVRDGLAAIDTDFIRDSNDIQECLFNRSWTTIPLAEQTERVDRAADGIAEGRLCLVVEGSPFVLLVPTTFFENVKDGEHALPGPINVAFVRNLRLVGIFTSITAGGLYAALLTADAQVLPTPLALAVANSRNGVPYPVLTETLIMSLVVDVFSEATAQSPGGIGNTLSIVGTLIIGQMAVQARLASSLMMIVVAATVLGAFLTLKYPFSYTLRVWKYPVIVLSGLAGLFGWMLGILLFLTHMASLKSGGVSYLSPLAPLRPRTLTHMTLTDAPRAKMKFRPASWKPQDPDRTGGRRR